MPTICYQDKNFRLDTIAMINKCNKIITEYQAQGYDLTLRQVYYQLVAHDLFPDDRKWRLTEKNKWVRDPNGTKNAEPNYDWLGAMINDARLAGLVDWDVIVDRTRELRELPEWEAPGDIVSACAKQFQIDLWRGQEKRVEVWIEKDALIGVIERACNSLDVPYFSCRGYTSQSEMWGAAQRIIRRYEDEDEQETVILHLGDHDPSGIDMSRDIGDRLSLFCTHHDVPEPEVKRIALNMYQVRRYNPPENPTKLSDSRAKDYIRRYGYDCWELDALTPQVINALVTRHVKQHLDLDLYNERFEEMKKHRQSLKLAADKWPAVTTALETGAIA
jgi:hypothetical protein